MQFPCCRDTLSASCTCSIQNVMSSKADSSSFVAMRPSRSKEEGSKYVQNKAVRPFGEKHICKNHCTAAQPIRPPGRCQKGPDRLTLVAKNVRKALLFQDRMGNFLKKSAELNGIEWMCGPECSAWRARRLARIPDPKHRKRGGQILI